VLPKRISTPSMNKLLSIALILALRCPLPQPPQDMLVCLTRFPFLRNFLDVFTDTSLLSTSLLMAFSSTSRFIYTFFHLDCTFTYTLLSTLFIFTSPSTSHRYLLILLGHRFLYSIGSKFISVLSAFCCFIYNVHSVVVPCTAHTVRFH